MDSAEILRQALQAARNGRELTARDLFQDVVRIDPNNEVAWMWLSGLLDPLQDRIAACERVLSINPENRKIRAYLDKLLVEYELVRQRQVTESCDDLQQVRRSIEAGERNKALFLLQNILREANDHIEAWRLFADLSASIDDKVRAYQAIIQTDPSDHAAREALKRYRYFQRHPLELAAHYEEEGDLDRALDLYQVLAAAAGDSSDFERIYKNITRLEGAKLENVRQVKPALSTLRLSLGWPLLYMIEILIQEGLNPISHPSPGLWLGIPLVTVGSFFLAVAGLRVRHEIWRRWFGDQNGRGSGLMRGIVALTGWMLVIAPHLFLFWDSYLRLQVFQTPAIPWIK